MNAGSSPKGHVTRREVLGRLGAGMFGGALTSALVACAPLPAASGQGTPGRATAPAVDPTVTASLTSTVARSALTSTAVPGANPDTPRRGGTLRFGNIGDFQSLEGQTIGANGAGDQLYGVWDRLIVTDSNKQLQPMLAESWEISDDSRQIKFNLRKGVLFHTGRELTSDDVKFSLQRIQDPKIGSVLTGRIADMTAVDTPDKYTVIAKASRPWVEAFDLFEQTNIIDQLTFQAAGLSKPSGTGPFMFVEYQQGDHLRLARNPNYWQNGLPYVDEVLVSIHPTDAQSAVVQLEAGALDLISVGLPITDMIRLQQDPSYQVLLNDHSGTSWIAFLNCARPPTDNKLVRQALNYALDRQRIADTVWHGLVNPITLPWSSTSPAYDAVKNAAYAFDLDKAAALLAQAGVTNTQLDITWGAGPSEYATMAQIYQADLAKLGFSVTLKPLEAAAFLAVRNNIDYEGVQFSAHTLGDLKPASNTLGISYGPERNQGNFKDDAYTQLVGKVVTEADPARQLTLDSQLNDYYLDQSWAMPIVPNPQRVAARAPVRGLRFDAHQVLVTAEVWLASAG
jgi:peptide/nickel transport system substrate-binding protein